MPLVARPRIVCLPSWDKTFDDDVHTVMASLDDGPATADLEAVLRKAYPAVKIRESELSGMWTPTWYVYRDGHFPWPSEPKPSPLESARPPVRGGGAPVIKETARLLDAWREAERAAGAARQAAEHAHEAAEAATKAAEAARLAAEDAGVTVGAADRVASSAKKAFHNHEAEALDAEEEERAKGVPGGLGEMT